MALTDFFRINRLYGLRKNSSGAWCVFNREYMPIGWNSIEVQKYLPYDSDFEKLPVNTRYKGLTEDAIRKIAPEPGAIQLND